MSKQQMLAEYLVTVAKEDPASEAGRLMEQRKVGSVIVVEKGRPVGIVTDRDLVLEVLNKNKSPDDVRVSAIMNPDPVTVPARTGPLTILHTMVEHGVRRIPVVDEDELVDVVSLDDLMRHLAREMNQLSQVIESETPDIFKRAS